MPLDPPAPAPGERTGDIHMARSTDLPPSSALASASNPGLALGRGDKGVLGWETPWGAAVGMGEGMLGPQGRAATWGGMCMCDGWLSVCCDAGNAKTHKKVMSRYRNESNASALTSTPEEEYTDLTAEKETVPVACFFGVGVDVPSPCMTYA